MLMMLARLIVFADAVPHGVFGTECQPLLLIALARLGFFGKGRPS